MGIKGLWQTIRSVESVESFTKYGLEAPMPRIVGVDASVWICQTQAPFSSPGVHFSSGQNAEIRTLYFRLLRLFKLGIIPIVVFDGDQRPPVKRNTRVLSEPHWMTQEFQSLLTAFGFHYYTAPGEAEAELARLNVEGMVDAVMTNDSDTFVFGATKVLLNPCIRKDGDDIKSYSTSLIRSRLSLSQGGLLIFALLCGGDYDPGLHGCGPKTALSLVQNTDLGETLLEAALKSDENAFSCYLVEWRERLRLALTDGSLGRKHHELANSLEEDFPNPTIIRFYTRPVTSWSQGLPPNSASWATGRVDLAQLAKLCERLFEWGSPEGIAIKFRQHGVYDGVALQHLRSQPQGLTASLIEHFRGTSPAPFRSGNFLSIWSECDMNGVLGYKVEISTHSLLSEAYSELLGTRGPIPCPIGPRPKTLVFIPKTLSHFLPPGLLSTFIKKTAQKRSKAKTMGHSDRRGNVFLHGSSANPIDVDHDY